MPASGALRPLVVVDVHEKSTADPGYQATADDVKAWEAEHGPVPEGSVVMFRSDWYKNWDDLENFAKAPFPGVRLDALKYLHRSEEHTSELQSLMRTSYAVFCLKKKKQ